MKTISVAAAFALFSVTAFAASEISVEGVVYGDLTNYSEKATGGGEKQHLFLNGSVNLGFSSGEVYNGLGFNLGARGNRKLFEKEKGDWGDANFDSTIFHTANLTYSNDLLTVVAGRQEINLEWLSDYHEAVVGIVTPSERLTIIAGFTGKYTESDYDGYYGGFEDVIPNGKQGAYVVDLIVAPVEGLTIEPWYYLVPDAANWFGGKLAFENDLFNVSAAYTASQLDEKYTKGFEDGSVLHAQAGVTPIEGLSVGVGYAATDEDGGSGLLGALVGDNVNPFEDGDYFFADDTSTIYIGAAYEADALGLSAALGVFDTGDKGGKGSINELDLIAEYGFTDWFALKGILVNVFGGDKAYKNEDYVSLRVAGIFSY
ncbi:MAG: Opr family porin [Helicobacteraceae bacterium]|jgi:hypothetical protein|nr:Opr family porin [Helicobacteraceae bacterium]